MKTILVAASKGGVGKTTVTAQLAARAALAGQRTVVADADPQGSARRWVERRKALAPAESLSTIDISRKRKLGSKVPEDTEVLIVDAPAGAMAEELRHVLERADAVVVPTLPSALDLDATSTFLSSLATVPRVHARALPVGLVLNRFRPWTQTSRQALAMLRDWPYPVVTTIRDSQAYVVLTGLGRSLFDYQSTHVREHQADWAPLLRWLDRL